MDRRRVYIRSRCLLLSINLDPSSLFIDLILIFQSRFTTLTTLLDGLSANSPKSLCSCGISGGGTALKPLMVPVHSAAINPFLSNSG